MLSNDKVEFIAGFDPVYPRRKKHKNRRKQKFYAIQYPLESYSFVVLDVTDENSHVSKHLMTPEEVRSKFGYELSETIIGIRT